jgi:hypothetical protein
MRIDNQDLVSKMEGFTVQGMKGLIIHHLFWPVPPGFFG